jgi:transcription antitermination factor NusG
MAFDIKPNWYVLFTVPNLEKKIHQELGRKKIKAYLPMQRVIRQWSDRRKELHIPLFPNYVFINTTEQERFGLYDIKGVLKFITYNGKPAVVSDEEITNIMRFENTVFDVEPHLIQGDNVIIVDGPFAGLQGKLFSKRGKQRFGVTLKSINQTLSLEVPASSLRKIE